MFAGFLVQLSLPELLENDGEVLVVQGYQRNFLFQCTLRKVITVLILAVAENQVFFTDTTVSTTPASALFAQLRVEVTSVGEKDRHAWIRIQEV